MSFTSQQTNAQSLNGIISISDGIVNIENGNISNVSNLEVDNLEIQNMTVDNDCTIDGNLMVLGNTTLNTSNITTLTAQTETITTSNITNLTAENVEITDAHIVNATIDNLLFDDIDIINFNVKNRLFTNKITAHTMALSNLNCNKSSIRHSRIKELVAQDSVIDKALITKAEIKSGDVATETTFSNKTAGYTQSLYNLNLNKLNNRHARIQELKAENSIMKNIIANNTTSTIITTKALIVEETLNILPAGMIMSTVTNSSQPPTGWLYCQGGAVDRIIYERLFLAIGSTFGSGDGTTTFNVPDFRGMFLRGYGVNNYTDPNTGLNPYSGTDIGVIQRDSLQNHIHDIVMQTVNSQISNYQDGGSGSAANNSWTAQLTGTVDIGTSPLFARASSETRPVNYSVNYLIKI